MVLQMKSELGGWWVKWAQDGNSQGGPKSELEVSVQFGEKKEKKSLILAAGSLESLKLQHSSWL